MIHTDTGGIITVYGQQFTDQHRVRLRDYGVLNTTYMGAGILQAAVPQGIPPRQYTVIVVDASGQRVDGWPQLTVIGQTATLSPVDPLPTPQPGTPAVAVRGFSVTPAPARVGDSMTIRVELVNQGTDIAQGIVLSLGQSEAFVPAGASGIIVGDLFPGAVVQAVINANVTNSAVNGANVIPLSISYRSSSGETLTATGSASATVEKSPDTSLLTLLNYTVSPQVVTPGETVTINVEVLNAGTTTALNTLIRVKGENSVLQAGSRGDTFLVGNVFPGGRIGAEIEMLVSQDAKPGAQVQPVEILYNNESGEQQTFSTSMTIVVDRSSRPEPLLLLKDYTIDVDELAPGSSFTLEATIENIGTGGASNALVSFGSNISTTTTDSGSGDDDENGSGTGGTGGSGGGSSGPTSAAFAPIGTGETTFIGALDSGATVTLEQRFLVSGTTKSGIYNLPITLRYDQPSGQSAQTVLQVNLLVVAQPRIQVTLQSPMPEEIEIGSTLVLAWQVQNLETTDVRLGSAAVSVDKGEVINGAETFLGRLTGDKRATFEGTIMPAEEGEMTVQLVIDYTDDMNRLRTFTYEYTTNVTAPMLPPEETAEPGPMIPEEPVIEEPAQSSTFIDLLFGFIGLGQ